MYDGNYVVASSHARPWRKQLNLLTAYLYFYNPVWFAVNLWRRKTRVGMKPAWMQIVGMHGVVHNVWRTAGWAVRLAFGKVERESGPPISAIPIRGVEGAHVHQEGFAAGEVVQIARRPNGLSLPVAG
jgi:hypothetical protein